MPLGNRASRRPGKARFLLFANAEMKTLARRVSENEHEADEVQGLQRALDKSYAEFREKALAEWQRRRPGGDPSDACVRVHIAPNGAQQTLTV